MRDAYGQPEEGLANPYNQLLNNRLYKKRFAIFLRRNRRGGRLYK